MAEDAREARAFLKAAGVIREFLLWSEHKEAATLDAIKAALKAGQRVCYFSSQGTPNLADPGRDLLQLADQLGEKTSSIPGPSSITTALSQCDFEHERFFYAGFLPREENDRLAALKEYAKLGVSLVILDTPYRLISVLETAIAVFGAGRRCLLAVDMTGENEHYWRDSLKSCRDKSVQLNQKLNFVLIVSPN